MDDEVKMILARVYDLSKINEYERALDCNVEGQDWQIAFTVRAAVGLRRGSSPVWLSRNFAFQLAAAGPVHADVERSSKRQTVGFTRWRGCPTAIPP